MIKTFEINNPNDIDATVNNFINEKPSKKKNGDNYIELRKLINIAICYNGSKYIIVVNYEDINKFTGR